MPGGPAERAGLRAGDLHRAGRREDAAGRGAVRSRHADGGFVARRCRDLRALSPFGYRIVLSTRPMSSCRSDQSGHLHRDRVGSRPSAVSRIARTLGHRPRPASSSLRFLLLTFCFVGARVDAVLFQAGEGYLSANAKMIDRPFQRFRHITGARRRDGVREAAECRLTENGPVNPLPDHLPFSCLPRDHLPCWHQLARPRGAARATSTSKRKLDCHA